MQINNRFKNIIREAIALFGGVTISAVCFIAIMMVDIKLNIMIDKTAFTLAISASSLLGASFMSRIHSSTKE